MARSIFANENKQNNKDQQSSIAKNDNKSTEVIIKKASNDNDNDHGGTSKSSVDETNYISDFEIRNELSRLGSSTNAAYKSTNVLVSESLVARLASKFNTVVVTENNNSSTRNMCTKTLPQQLYPAEKPITFRKSCVQKKIKFFEKDLNKTSSSSDIIKTVENLNSVAYRRTLGSSSVFENNSNNNNSSSSSSSSSSNDSSSRSSDDNNNNNNNNNNKCMNENARNEINMLNNAASDGRVERKSCPELEKSDKPVLRPKPKIMILSNGVQVYKNRQLQAAQRTDEVHVREIGDKKKNELQSRNSVLYCDFEKHYHAPKIYAKKDRNLILKDKRLSIAKDFSLESILNNDIMERSPEENKNEADLHSKNEEATIVCDNNKMANNSFLHKYLEQCVETNKLAVGNMLKDENLFHIYDQLKERQPTTVKTSKNSSSLHDSLMKTLNSRSEEDCENVPSSKEMIYSHVVDAVGDDGHYHYPHLNELHNEGHLANDYADVIYAQLCSKKEDAEYYETISSESCENFPTTLKDVFPPQADVHMIDSGSECSLEQTNSLYETKPPSDCPSAPSPVLCYSSSNNDFVYAKIDIFTDVKIPSSGVSDDEENAYYCDSDVNDHSETNGKHMNSSRSKRYRKRKQKLSINAKVSVDSCSIIYFESKFENLDINKSRRNEKIGSQSNELITVARSILHPLPNYEAQEITLLIEFPDDYSQSFENVEEICDDFDDSSSETEFCDIQTISQSRKQPLPNIHSENIFDKARKTVQKSLSSLNQIRKKSVGSISIKSQDGYTQSHKTKSLSVDEINLKDSPSVSNGNSVRWTSFKSKLRVRYPTITSSTSTFYLDPNDLMFNKCDNVTKKQTLNKGRRQTTCVELRPTNRPTSPPPPPPVDRSKKISETSSISTMSIYSDPSTKSSNSGSELNSELNSSQSSDLQLLFADEPLYQFYTDSITQLTTTASFDCSTDSDCYEEIASTTSRPSAMELITPSPNGHGQYRSLWCEVPEVMNSGILDTLSSSRKKLQEAMFEIITSEASYYKSLSVLDKVFVNSSLLKDESVLSKNDWKILFGNVGAVKKCSEKLLAALEACWQDSILLTGLCDVILHHANENFRIYVKYCSNQIYIDRTLKTLKEQNSKFVDILNQLESNPKCQSLNLHSFLMLPMQRITRMPLLIDAVLSKMDSVNDEIEYKTYQMTLATLNKIVRDCNESARKLERYEEMLLLSRQLEFSRKDVKTFSVASSSRWLIRSGPMVHINPPDTKLTFTRKLTKQTAKYYFFLFNDIMVVAKKKNDETYVVFDYCARNVVQMSLLEDNCIVFPNVSSLPYRYLVMLTILENHEGKTVEMILNCDSDSTRQRWLEATSSHLISDNPEEKLYEEWDCPQVSAVHSYTAVQPDELSLHAGDVVKVLKKTTDGWCHGERIRDGTTGWFPGNYTIEIASQHTRAKNLKLRHRLLTLSGNYLQNQQQKNPNFLQFLLKLLFTVIPFLPFLNFLLIFLKFAFVSIMFLMLIYLM